MSSISEPLFQVCINANPQAKNMYEREVESQTARRLEDLRLHSNTAWKHDLMILACASVFMPEGEVDAQTGFSFYSSEPLVELVLGGATDAAPKVFDFLLINPQRQAIIVGECKTAHNTTDLYCYEGDIRKIWEKLEGVMDRVDYLSEVVGFRIEEIEAVLCVEQRQANRAAHSLARVENGRDSMTSDPTYAIKLWTWNQYENMCLQLASAIQRNDPFWNRHRSDSLTQALGDGVVQGSREAVAPCFVNSPSWQQAQALGVHVAETIQEEALAEGRDEPFSSEFGKEEAVSFFADSLMHYAASSLSPLIAGSVLQKLVAFDMVRSISEENYVLSIAARGPDTVGMRFKNALLEGLARQGAADKAVEKVLAHYSEAQPTLWADL